MKLTHNMGRIDRRLRGFLIGPGAIVAAALIGAGSVVGIILTALGLIMLVTAAVGVCPLYALFGLDTRRDARHALGG
jgi:Protein of unknown function (DUF2892)